MTDAQLLEALPERMRLALRGVQTAMAKHMDVEFAIEVHLSSNAIRLHLGVVHCWVDYGDGREPKHRPYISPSFGVQEAHLESSDSLSWASHFASIAPVWLDVIFYVFAEFKAADAVLEPSEEPF